MQLAHPEQDPDREKSPSIRAVPIDSLFEASGTVLAGIVFVVIAAAMTAMKTGQNLTWACVALLIMAGAVRAFDLRRYHARKSTPATSSAVLRNCSAVNPFSPE